MNKVIESFKNTVSKLNTKKDKWSFLTSISYMLDSKLYIDSLLSSAKTLKYRIRPKDKILDFGTGSGIFAVILRELFPANTISAIDTNDNQSQKDPNFNDAVNQQKLLWKDLAKKSKIKFKHYDGSKLPFADNSFDVISACAVIEHVNIENVQGVINELQRVLRPGGLLLVLKLPRTNSYSEWITKKIGLGGHEILYSDNTAERIFSGNGFTSLINWRTDMVFDFPGKITNLVYLPLKILNYLLLICPLDKYSHHNNFIFKNGY